MRDMWRWFVLAAAWVLGGVLAVQVYRQTAAAPATPQVEGRSALLHPVAEDIPLDAPERWIAHGGGVGRLVYTNCEEAVRDSLARGFHFVELDLLETRDGHLVGGHSWKELKAHLGAMDCSESPMTRADIEALRGSWSYTPLFAEGICSLLQEHPHMVLVTDKTQNFDLLRRTVPYPERMIVEAATHADYQRAVAAGFSHVALTAYTMEQLAVAEKHGLAGVVLGAWLLELDPFSAPIIRKLRAAGCCIMVHGSTICDKPDFVHAYLGNTVDRIYTDTWSPQNIPPRPGK